MLRNDSKLTAMPDVSDSDSVHSFTAARSSFTHTRYYTVRHCSAESLHLSNRQTNWQSICYNFHRYYTSRASNSSFSEHSVHYKLDYYCHCHGCDGKDEWQWHHLSDMQICTSPKTDSHSSIPLLSFYRPEAIPDTQPTASKHSKCNKKAVYIQYSMTTCLYQANKNAITIIILSLHLV